MKHEKNKSKTSRRYACYIGIKPIIRDIILLLSCFAFYMPLKAQQVTQTICEGDKLRLRLSGLNGTETVSWSSLSHLSCYSCKSPLASPVTQTTYTATVNGIPRSLAIKVKSALYDAFINRWANPNGTDTMDKILGVARDENSCGMVGCGYTRQAAGLVTAMNSLGGKIWSRNYGLTVQGGEMAFCSITSASKIVNNEKIPDGYVVGGHVRLEGRSDYDIIIMRLDTTGKILSYLLLGDSLWRDDLWQIKQTDDGGYIAIGTSEGYGANGSGRSHVIKIRPNFTLDWDNTYSMSSFYDNTWSTGNQEGRDIIETTDGYIFVGSITFPIYNDPSFSKFKNGFVTKIEKQHGIHQWTRLYARTAIDYEAPPEEEATSIVQENDNAFDIIGSGSTIFRPVGSESSSNGLEGILLRIDASGLPINNTMYTIDGAQFTQGVAIDISPDTKKAILLFNVKGATYSVAGLVGWSTITKDILWKRSFPAITKATVSNNFISNNRSVFFAVNHTKGSNTYPYFIQTDNMGNNGCNNDVDLSCHSQPCYQDTLAVYVNQHGLTHTHDFQDWESEDMQVLPVCDNAIHLSTCPIGGGSPVYINDFPIGVPQTFFSDLNPNNTNYPAFTAGDYTVVPNAAMVKPFWQGSDNTGNGSGIFVTQGPSATGTRALYTTVPVQAGKLYGFCVTAKNLCAMCEYNPIIELRVNGHSGDLVSAPTELFSQDGWVNVSGTYKATATGLLEFDIVPAALPGSGDFALDDVSVYEKTAQMLPKNALDAKHIQLSDYGILFPNPIKNGEVLNLSLSSNSKHPANVRILNNVGSVVYAQSYELETGNNELKIPIQSLAPGIYIVTAESNGQRFTGRMVVTE